MSAADQGQLIAQLKAEINELRASCLKLSNHPNASNTTAKRIDKLEREAQQARRQYDQLLSDRRKQAAELEQLVTQFQELQTGANEQQDSPAQQQLRQLQTQINSTMRQVSEATAVQQHYQDVIQQLKEGHQQFQEEVNQITAEVQKQQELACQCKAQLLQAQHQRDAAKRDLQAAEQKLMTSRAGRTDTMQQLAQQCQTRLQQQLASPQRSSSQVSCSVQQQTVYDGGSQALIVQQACSNMGSGKLLDDLSGHASAMQILKELLLVTDCSSTEQLTVHIQALQQAHSGLLEAGGAMTADQLADAT